MALWKWLGRRHRDHDLQAEIASHLAMATRDRIAHGQDPEAARRAALKEFGNVTLTREATRRAWGGLWIEHVGDVVRDARYALRLLLRSPAYSLIVIAVLALGIGANVVVFALFNALAISPLPAVPAANELLVIMAQTSSGRSVPLSYPDYRDLRSQSRSYVNLAAATMQGYSLGTGPKVEDIFGELVTGNYFAVLGVGAQIGRTILPSDEVVAGQHPVVVLADALWRRAFSSDPSIVGKTIHINGLPLTVVGVAVPGFRGSVVGTSNDVFVPVMMQPQVSGCVCNMLEDRKGALFFAFGRPRPGIDLEQARAEASVLSARLSAQHPVDTVTQRAVVTALWESPYGAQTYMLPAVTLMGAMGALLLVVVCANVAGLVLVRGITRRGEIAARLALGASRGRILRLLLAENLVLAVPGALLGLSLPMLVEPFLRGPESSMTLPLYFNVESDLIPAFGLVVALASAVLSGFLPGLVASRFDLAAVMKDGLAPVGPPKARLRTALVLAQIAMSVILLVGTALVVRSLDAARRVNAGFDASHVAWAATDVKLNGYTEDRGKAFYQQLLDNARASQGVEAASLAIYLPLTLIDMDTTEVVVEGHERRRDEDLQFLFNVVSPGYFATLRIPLVTGRDFTPQDDEAGPSVAIVNEAFAHRFWGSSAAAIGKRIQAPTWSKPPAKWHMIVGVARTAKYTSLTEDPRPYIYLPHSQRYASRLMLHVRGAGIATPLEHVRAQVHALDANVAVLDARMLSEQMETGVAIFDVTARMLAIIGAVSIALAALGIYGLVAYSVKQRTQEIGIRLAIGAQRGEILRQFLAVGLRLGAAGAAIGFAVALVATRLMASLLFGVSATDPLSFLTSAAVALLIALLASLVPAWWGARIDPLVALRHS